jgi:hypothetical protein
MARHTLYAYIEGYDNQSIAEALEARLMTFIGDTSWTYGRPWVVNQQREDSSLQPGDLAPWEIGLNYALPDPGHEPREWFSDVERIALLMSQLHGEFDRTFVMGIGDNNTGFSEDLYFIDSKRPDLQQLRAIIGVPDEPRL